MASNLKISTLARSNACNAVVDLIDSGLTTNNGWCRIYTGAPPASPASPDSGTLLAELAFRTPNDGGAFGAASTGTATAAAITPDTNANNSGDAGHFRIKDSSGAVVIQGTAGTDADTPDMSFGANKTIVTGGTVAITSMTFTIPEQ